MKLLVSVVDRREARIASKLGVDIVDVKNPREGALGASPPRVIRDIKMMIPRGIEVSATIGDLPNLPGMASLAARGAATLGVDYVKAGLYGVSRVRDGLKLAREVCMAVKEVSPDVKVVLVGYADYYRIGSIEPMKIVELAVKVGADGVMIDVKSKGESNVFDHLDLGYLSMLVDKASSNGLIKALAGGLTLDDIDTAYRLGFDVVGVRRAACNVRNWVRSRLDEGRLSTLIEKVRYLNSIAT
ncbi:MAG: (5-formylfuran-3-yl)methyl phosphate synthase [Nitrososphaerota archaeon]|nr:(5-formylfuran-3-yl)methyl phosphate synthase [Candidatus Bathyarchaeota archaeon]MDW8061966.1 (5-formylfuran-3-yl)methyl phosphate synthase [Nitrososphaerota archaeon]